MKKTINLLFLIATLSITVSATTYQNYYDHMDASKWRVYDSTPSGATIKVVEDEIHGRPVMELKGEGTKNGYILGSWSGEKAWNNIMGTKITWRARFDEDFVIYISVKTKKGHRYLYYTPVDRDYGINTSKTYIHHGLGTSVKDGTWKANTRDLEKDLQEFESDNSILAVNAFLVRGSGYLSEIEIHDNEYAKMITKSKNGDTILISNGRAISSIDKNYLNFTPSTVYYSEKIIKDMVLSSDGERLFLLHNDSLEVIAMHSQYHTPIVIDSYKVSNGNSFFINEEENKAFIAIGKGGVITLDIK